MKKKHAKEQLKNIKNRLKELQLLEDEHNRNLLELRKKIFLYNIDLNQADDVKDPEKIKELENEIADAIQRKKSYLSLLQYVKIENETLVKKAIEIIVKM